MKSEILSISNQNVRAAKSGLMNGIALKIRKKGVN
jgi:hypothetical protein